MSTGFPSTATNNQHLHLFSPENDDALSHDALGDGSMSPSDGDSDAFCPEDYTSPTMMSYNTDTSNLGFPTLVTSYLPQQVPAEVEVHIPSPDGSIHDHMGHQMVKLEPAEAFIPFTGTATDDIIAPIPTFPSQLLTGDALPSHLDMKTEELGEHGHGLGLGMPQIQTPSESGDLRFKSPPPPSNIASRRNKGVPAQLNSTALCSYSYGPKTGIDMSKRGETPCSMRRVASATGFLPSRIQKASLGAPRSPLYVERTKDALARSLQDARSPVLGSLNTALSPVARSDCSLSLTQDARENTVSSSASDDERRYPYGPSHGAFFRLETLRTPPGTPGMSRAFSDQVVSTDTPWNYPTSDEPLITPGLGSFGSEEFSMAQAAPGYVVHSQPPTPSFAPGIGPSYFPWGINGAAPNAEYTFPGESYIASDVSAKSSPGQPKSKQFQFTQNVTPQDFSAEK